MCHKSLLQNSLRRIASKILETTDYLERIVSQSPAEFLARHARGDWGDLGDDDKQANEESLLHGSRVVSVYSLASGWKIYVITDAADDGGKRACTTLMMADEY